MAQRCPICGSTNVDTTTSHKIKKGATYVADFALGFLFGKAAVNVMQETGGVSDNVNIKKEYECKSCGHVWKEDGQAPLISSNTTGSGWDDFIYVLNNIGGIDQEETNKEFFNICRQLHHEGGQYAGYYRFLESMLYFDRVFYDMQINGKNSAYNDLLKAQNLIDEAIAKNYDADFEVLRIAILMWKIYFEDPVKGYEELKTIHLLYSREELFNAFATSHTSKGVMEYIWAHEFEGDEFADDFNDCKDYTSIWFDLQFMNVILYCARVCENGSDNMAPDLRMALNYCRLIADSTLPYDEANSTITVREKIEELSRMVNSAPSNQATISKSEGEYLEALNELLADGDITERDRRMLERMRNSLGITEKKAQELEASIST